MSSGTKWRCVLCTYENWPAAVKCTLCRSPRTTSRIEEDMQRMQVSSQETEDLDPPGHACVPTETDQRLIKCASCTYLNKPKSFKCEQCFHVLCDPADLQCTAVRSSIPSASVPAPTTTTTSIAPTPPPLSVMLDEDKWSCPQCTYENWPKSKHCVMCYGPPPPTPPSVSSTVSSTAPVSNTSPSMESQQPAPSVDSVEDCTLRDFIPSSGPSGLPGSKRPKAVALLMGPPASTTNPNVFRDKLWLAACRAVSDGEVTPIERYILTGGRMERKLSKQECRYLDNLSSSSPTVPGDTSYAMNAAPRPASDGSSSPVDDTLPGACASDSSSYTVDESGACASRFRAGLTLVDLAIRFGRTDLINLFIALSGLQATSAAVSLNPPNKNLPARSSFVSGATAAEVKSGSLSRRASANPIHPSLQQIITRAPSLLNKHGVTRSKWMPCQASPVVARELRATLASSVKHPPTGDFPCAFINEWSTFALPHAVGKLPAPVKYLLLSELCDTQAQSELEEDAKAINWWFIPGQKQASRLFALWNRTAGDCLLDSVLQACWGIFDRENCLRRTLAESLRTCEASFYSRWRDYEALQAACHYILDENQCRRDWDNVLAAADQPGGALEQIHIFALSHILRRPIIVYGVKYIKNYRDEPIGIANFQGIYIPLLWDRSFCSPNPIVLGYTRGHFTALVPMEPQQLGVGPEPQLSPIIQSSPYTSPRPTIPGCSSASSTIPSVTVSSSGSSSRKHSPSPSEEHPLVTGSDVLNVTENLPSSGQVPHTLASLSSGGCVTHNSFIYLPLVDRQGGLLPVHFTTEKEANLSHLLLRDWLDVVSTRRGLPLARLRLQSRHTLVDRMMDDWLESYRSLAKLSVPSGSSASSSSSSSATGTLNTSHSNRDILGGSSGHDSHSSSSSTSSTDLCVRADLPDSTVENRSESSP
ncbi:Ubiquitin thioesterase trabid [Fasciola hepatica]|uniref:ubiquitinyl hydrolase 1 n=1 Tax=Fasciola hepatica TaxID=6192 RepID=A0A4E0R4A2_FASHE|nr:Ubiquitin thioesterase trabid [Fasciola hepatica]